MVPLREIEIVFLAPFAIFAVSHDREDGEGRIETFNRIPEELLPRQRL